MNTEEQERADAADDLIRAMLRVARQCRSEADYLALIGSIVLPLYYIARSGMTEDQVIEQFRQIDMATQPKPKDPS